MTEAQRKFIEVQKRQSTLRGEFNELRAVETRSTEQDGRLTALDGELTASEAEFRTAADALLADQSTVTAPAGEDTEARERRELCDRANVGDVYNSILEKRGATDGATSEAQAAHGCAPNQIPLAMLAAPTEVRAVTPTPGASETEQAETVQPVFATGAGAFLSIDPPVRRYGPGGVPGAHVAADCGRAAREQYGRRGHDRGVRRGAVAAEADTGWLHLPPDGCHAVQQHGQRASFRA